jgi:hypothetical protein
MFLGSVDGTSLKMKIIICFRHLKCICHKWRKGTDYSWHVQHLLREFGCGHFADRGRGSALSKALAERRRQSSRDSRVPQC